MTKEEAIIALTQGKVITHEYFGKEEYIHLVNNKHYFEDGVQVPKEWWNKGYLSDNWSIYKS